MPIFFIHGVNVRNTDPGYNTGLTARNELLQRMVIQPLAAQDARFRQMQIVSPYWGGAGVRFYWDLASLPPSAVTEAAAILEAAGEAPGEADRITAETVAAIALTPEPGAIGHEAAMVEDGAASDLVKRAARRDPVRLVESLLTPLLLAETELLGEAADAPSEGQLQAQLAMAAYAVANDPAVQEQIEQAQSDEEVIDLLTRAVQARFAAAVAEASPTREAAVVEEGAVESLPDWLEGVQQSIGGLFGRVLSGPVEALATSFVQQRRMALHRNLARFMGDIFVYLIGRGEVVAPGPIVTTVLDALRNTPKGHPDEPVIVITHSMGGNILYDLLTDYAPDLQVDVWISVGGQVAQFEEMKLFRKSDVRVGAPQKVPRPNVGYWLNVYDPADILSFRVDPVFAGVDADAAFETGASVLKAHGEYFGRASFYELVRQHIARAV